MDGELDLLAVLGVLGLVLSLFVSFVRLVVLVLSLRATGEGHISSITFRSGTIDAAGAIRIDEPTRFTT